MRSLSAWAPLHWSPGRLIFPRLVTWHGKSRLRPIRGHWRSKKSTVPAHTGEQLRRALQVYGRSNRTTFRVASNPEFLREGTAMADFFHTERIVVGVEDAESERQPRNLQAISGTQVSLPGARAEMPTGTRFSSDHHRHRRIQSSTSRILSWV
jgi:hypothetical protein